MVVAQRVALVGQDLVVEVVGLVVVAEGGEICGEAFRRGQGVGLVVAEHSPVAAQGVFVEPTSLLIGAVSV